MKKSFSPADQSIFNLNCRSKSEECLPFSIFSLPGDAAEKEKEKTVRQIFQFFCISGGIEAKCHTIGREVFLARSLLFFPWIFRDFLVK